jgi:hypothetical protein
MPPIGPGDRRRGQRPHLAGAECTQQLHRSDLAGDAVRPLFLRRAAGLREVAQGAQEDSGSRVPRRRVRPWLHSEQNTKLKYAAGLGRIDAARAKNQTRRRAGRSDMGKLDAGKEYLVLVSRCPGYRPRVAPRTIEQIRCAIDEAVRAGNIFEANRQADAGQGRVVAKAVICEYPSASRRGGRTPSGFCKKN